MLNGSARFAVVDQDGGNTIDDVQQGDLWFVPAGVPHSIQALDEGCEFLLVFDQGDFDEDATLLLTDFIAHTPKSVLAKNFHVDESAFDASPQQEKYIFHGSDAGTLQSQTVDSPQGKSASAYTYHASQQNFTQVDGGRLKIVDSSTFTIATTLAMAEVVIQPGAMRELHWVRHVLSPCIFSSGKKLREC